MVSAGTDVELVLDAFFEQQAAHGFVLAAADIVFGGAQDDGHFPKSGIGSAGEEIHRFVEIDVIIVVAVCKGPDIEHPAHGKAVRGERWMAEGKIGGLVSAEA